LHHPSRRGFHAPNDPIWQSSKTSVRTNRTVSCALPAVSKVCHSPAAAETAAAHAIVCTRIATDPTRSHRQPLPRLSPGFAPSQFTPSLRPPMNLMNLVGGHRIPSLAHFTFVNFNCLLFNSSSALLSALLCASTPHHPAFLLWSKVCVAF
jgi:hypothetical protein